MKIDGEFEFAECLEIFLFKIKDNVDEAKKKKKKCVYLNLKKGKEMMRKIGCLCLNFLKYKRLRGCKWLRTWV